MRFVSLLLIGLLVGCGSQQQATTKLVDENPRPSWVRQKPISPAYYHGIGFAYKIPGRDDHTQMARNNALNDLAGEISVNISSQSLLYQVESNQRVRDTYKSTILSSSNASLEGYELVGVWENEREVWNFYRLSKAEHERIQREKRQKAVDMAVAQWERAEREPDPMRRFTGYVSALDAIKVYLGEPLTADINGERVFIANHVMNTMRRLVDEWTVTPSQHVTPIKRGQAIRIPSTMWDGASIFFTVNHNRSPLINVPCVLSYSGRRGHREEALTDRNGHVYFTWERIVSQRSQEHLQVHVNLRELARESSDNELILSIVDQLREPTASTTIDIIPAVIFIRSDERLFDERMNGSPIQAAFTSELRKDGFELTRNEADADFVLELNATTRTGNGRGETTQFTTAYIDMTVQLIDQVSGQIAFSKQVEGIRGVQLDEERAGREAFNRAIRDVQREIYPDMRRKAFW